MFGLIQSVFFDELLAVSLFNGRIDQNACYRFDSCQASEYAFINACINDSGASDFDPARRALGEAALFPV